MADATSQEFKQEQQVTNAVMGVERGTDREKAAAKKIRLEIQEKHSETVLKNLRAEGMGPVSDADIEATLDRIISADKDADGNEKRDPTTKKKERTGTNQLHFDRAKQNLDQANAILKDFKTLLPAERTAMFGRIQSMLRIAYPEAADALATASTPDERDTLLENIFRNPEFARLLHGKMEGILKTELKKPSTELANRIADARKELEEKRIELRKKQDHSSTAETERLAFDKSPGNGKKLRELNKLEGEGWELKVKNLNAEVETLSSNIAQKQKELERSIDAANSGIVNQYDKTTGNLIGQRAPSISQADITRIKGELTAAESDLITKKAALNEAEENVKQLSKLREEKAKAEEKAKDAKSAEELADVAFKNAEDKLRNASIEMEELKLGVHEDNFIHETGSVVEESVRDFLATQVEKADQKRLELLENTQKHESDEAKKNAEHQVTELVRERWHKKGRMRKGRIQDDLRDLLTSEDSLRTKLGLSEEVWKDHKDEVISSLLGYRINMGGLPANEAWMLYNRYGKEMYEHAIHKRHEFVEWKKYAEEHNLIKGSGFDGIANFVKEHPGMIGVILALLALGGAQVLAPGWTAAKIAAVSKGVRGSNLEKLLS